MRSMTIRSLAVLLLTAPLAFLSAQQAPKYALVIGNADYSDLGSLKNPVNDATDMAHKLEELGFVVDRVIDADLIAMEEALGSFKNRLSVSDESIGLFYFAGHGVQSGGQNYLIPSQSRIPSESYLKTRGFSVQILMDELAGARNFLNIVILDACRDNPFGWNRSGTRGLTVVSSQPAGSLVVYATSAGSTAQDGDGRNGLFTSQLLDHLDTPGIPVEEVFKRTGAAVQERSGGSQIPAIYNQFFGEAYLNATTEPAGANEVASVPDRSLAEDGMIRLPRGSFLMGSPLVESGRYADEPLHRVSLGPFWIASHETTIAEWNALMEHRQLSVYAAGDQLPVEYVMWEQAVEYCNRRSLSEGLTPAYALYGETDPDRWIRSAVGSNASNLVNVTCDFNADGYRLPTEAEWEYACRAGTTTATAFGDRPDATRIAFGESRPLSAVGSFEPNAWGLYDTHGSVWEWCWDRYRYYLALAQDDPANRYGPAAHVIRGGDHRSEFREIRSANRGVSEYGAGFRVVRTAQPEEIR